MRRHNYKTPGLIRAGFHYQDLVAIEVLIDFYRDRKLYEWVKIDAEDEAFRSVEDVVACTHEGLYDLTQVKFTAAPDDPGNSLSWQWLTKSKPNGKSLLQKWSTTTLAHTTDGTLRRAQLKTDRIPDADVTSCLVGSKVSYDALSTQTKQIVDTQIGSEAQARSFFGVFEFHHSYPRLDDLEAKLWARLASDTDRGGWAVFRQEVQNWSTLKNQPGPDGRIRYIHLRQAFSVEKPRPIPQGFLVPPNYIVPDAKFDTGFFSQIVGGDGVTVLWGPPGRGKSTYLSHCVERVDLKQAVCIRHHYFLSLDDRSEGRFHYQAIARSLEHQIEEALPETKGSRHTIGDLIQSAANRLAPEGRRLIVIVDGLDHVWRENRDHEEMEELFNSLLPLPPNVHLVVGTQKIPDQYLPARLLAALPPEDWVELPLMSPAAVRKWVAHQDKAGRLNLDLFGHRTRSEALRTVAQAFYEVSQGLPLHLIYSFEALARPGAPVTTDGVRALPACPTGDIRDYYRAFWLRLAPRARSILHVLAGLAFGPPPFALGQCFGLNEDSLKAISDIGHLLDYREIEVRPFHGSLFAFVSELPTHQAEFTANATAVRDWLETGAPEYWRWAWLWITKAQLGESSDLISGPNRAWAIDALMQGFPIEQLIAVISHAEKLAFADLDLPRTLELRSLKVRALNGPEFHAYDTWAFFPEVAIAEAADPYIAAVLRSNPRQAPASFFPYIVRSADPSLRSSVADRAIYELNYRINNRSDQEVVSSDRQDKLAEAIVGVVAQLNSDNARRLVSFAKHGSATDHLIALYAQEALVAGNIDNVFAVGRLWGGHETDRAIFTALCLEGLSPAAQPLLKSLAHSATRCLALLKGDTAKPSKVKRDIAHLFVGGEGPDGRFYEGTRAVLYDCFFSALAVALGKGKGKAVGRALIPEAASEAWLAGGVRALEELAQNIADRWKATGAWPTLGDLYRDFSYERTYGLSHDTQRRFIALRLAFQDIAIDLSLLARALDPAAAISAADMGAMGASPYWLAELWLDAFTDRRLPLHTTDAAKVFLERYGQHLDQTVTQFDERTAAAVRLALFASDHSVHDLAASELRRAVECLLGYGHRKDSFAFEVLASLEILSDADPEAVKAEILGLAGAFETITLYTDGDETDHAREEYYELLARYFPDRVPSCYARLISKEEWRYASTLLLNMTGAAAMDSNAGERLLETFIDANERSALAEVSDSSSGAKAALTAVNTKIGPSPGDALRRERRDRNTSPQSDESSAEPEVLPSIDAYPPSELEGYLASISGARDYERRRTLVAEWLQHWATAGRASEALADLEKMIPVGRRSLDLDEALDVAFDISLKAEGRSKAFAWLVRAHVTRYGWQRWYTSREESEGRLAKAARNYPGQWREFITESSRSALPTRVDATGIVVGMSRLVFFLLEVGELQQAREYVRAMVRIFKEELSEQPISMPGWAA